MMPRCVTNGKKGSYPLDSVPETFFCLSVIGEIALPIWYADL
jgi:hypothetical protein